MDKLGLYTTSKIISLVALLPSAILGSVDILYKSGDFISGRGTGAVDVIRDTMIISGVYTAYLLTSTWERNELLDKYSNTNTDLDYTSQIPKKSKSKVTIDNFLGGEEYTFHKFKDDEEEYLKILSREPKDEDALWSLATIYFAKKEYNKSLEQLKVLKQINQKFYVWNKIGANFEKLGQEDDAHKAYAKANGQKNILKKNISNQEL